FAAIGYNCIDASAGGFEADDVGESGDLDAELFRRLGVAPQKRPGEDDAVVGVEAGGANIVDVELGDDRSRFFRRQHAGDKTAIVLDSNALLERAHLFVAMREKQVAAL